jgi:hypothetical protein
LLAGPWPDLVFHVLDHVEGTARLPASSFDRRYVAFCREHLGPAEERTLGEDARVLSVVAPNHRTLASVQLLAWTFASLERAVAAAPRELGELRDGDVDRPELLGMLREHRDATEILRCAAELEREHHARLPPVATSFDAVTEELARVGLAAPWLARCPVRLVRALCLRGRVLQREIWVGVPDPVLGVTVEHVSWQAAHEATVAEVSERGELAEREVEHAAVVLLAERARRAGLARGHARWLAHFGTNAPPIQSTLLPQHVQNVVDELLRSEG